MAWEKRWHPLREEWVTITSHRNTRPWSGAKAGATLLPPAFDPNCYLCPGNARVSGEQNPAFESVFVFDNDHPSFSLDPPQPEPAPGIYRSAPARGKCRVICYSPKHNLTLAELDVAATRTIVDSWAAETAAIGAIDGISCVFVFENKGEIVGVSNPHPHGQIYATDFVFRNIEVELAAMAAWHGQTGGNLFQDIIETEQTDGRRIIAGNEHAIAFIPYFARFPFETYIAPRRSHAHLFDLSSEERLGLAQVLNEVLIRLDNLWQMSFPYMLAIHQAPTDGGEYGHYHCHIQLHPPLRAPGLQKFLAGVETGGGNFLNDASPEEKAAELRATPRVHFRQAG